MTSTILIGNSRIDVNIESGSMQASKADLMKWVRWAAESVSAYYGRFPVPQLLLRIVPSDGKGVRGGRTFGRDNGGFITIHVGKDAQFSDLAQRLDADARDGPLCPSLLSLTIIIGSKKASPRTSNPSRASAPAISTPIKCGLK